MSDTAHHPLKVNGRSRVERRCAGGWARTTPECTVGTEGVASPPTPPSTLHPKSEGGLGSATQCPVVVHLGRGRNKGWRLSAALKQWGRTPGVTETQVRARGTHCDSANAHTHTCSYLSSFPSARGQPQPPRVSGSL